MWLVLFTAYIITSSDADYQSIPDLSFLMGPLIVLTIALSVLGWSIGTAFTKTLQGPPFPKPIPGPKFIRRKE